MTPYLSAATKAATARRALLLLTLIALIAAGTVMGYFSVLDLVAINRATEDDASRALSTVLTANVVVLCAVPVAWFFLLRWLAASLRNAHALATPRPVVALAMINREVLLAALPGPLIGQPSRLMAAHTRSLADAHLHTGASRLKADDSSARWAGRLSLIVAPLWVFGLMSSGTYAQSVIWVPAAWVALSAVAILLRQAIAKIQLSEELMSALHTADERSSARAAR